jgi:hypothetical protein
MANIIILVPEGVTNESLGVYTWFPFRSHDTCTHVQEYVLLDRWLMNGYGRFVQNSSLFPPKIPNDLLGCTFRASTYDNKPYVEISELTEPATNCSRRHYSGLEVRVLRVIAETMNATLVFRDTAPRSGYMWGYRLQNGTVTGILGDVLYGRSDIALSSMPKGFDILETVLESTVSYFGSALLWYVRCPRRRERWESLSRMLSAPLCVTVATTYILMVLLTWKIAEYGNKRALRESRLYLSVTEVFHTLLVVFVGASGAQMPRTATVRLIFSIWLWYSFAFNLISQTFYTSILVDPGVLRQIRNIDELLESGLKLAYVHELDHLYRDGNDVREQTILRRRNYCVDVGSCLDQAAVKGDVATIANNLDISFRSNNSHLLCRLEDEIFRFSLAMFMAKGSPLLARVDVIILRLLEAGLLHQWLKDQNSDQKRRMQEVEETYFVFAVSHLSVALVCFISGHILSFFVFICEVFYHRFRSARRSQCRKKKKEILFVKVNRRFNSDTHLH